MANGHKDLRVESDDGKCSLDVNLAQRQNALRPWCRGEEAVDGRRCHTLMMAFPKAVALKNVQKGMRKYPQESPAKSKS